MRNRLGRRRYCRFLTQSSDGFAQLKGFLLLPAQPPQRNRSVSSLATADDQHDGYLGEAVLAHLVVDLRISGIDIGSQPCRRAFPLDLAGIFRRFRGYAGDDDLHRRQPQRETTGIVFDQDADETLHRAEDRPLEHDRGMAHAILADIDGSEPPRHVEIKLNRAALPLPAERVAEVEFELRPVERALAGVERI